MSGHFLGEIFNIDWNFESTWLSFILSFLSVIILAEYYWSVLSVFWLLFKQLYDIYWSIFWSYWMFSLWRHTICTQWSFMQEISLYLINQSSQASILKCWMCNHPLHLLCQFSNSSHWWHLQYAWFLWWRSLSSVSHQSVETLSRSSWCGSSTFCWWGSDDK